MLYYLPRVGVHGMSMGNLRRRYRNIRQDRVAKIIKQKGTKYRYIATTGGHKFTVDSGATVHCVGDKKLFDNIYKGAKVKLRVADNRVVVSHAVGDVTVRMMDESGVFSEVTLHNVVYHPHFKDNLLSVHRLWHDSRIGVRFEDRNHLKCMRTGRNFRFRFDGGYRIHVAKSVSILDSESIHRRFGHCSEARLKKMAGRCNGFPKVPAGFSHDPTSCDSCLAGGSKRKPFHKRTSQHFTYFGERLSSDLFGPFPKSIRGCRYAMCIVDSATNYLWVKLLPTKESANVREGLEEFLTSHKQYLQHGRPIRWHTDNGGEFMSDDLDEFCKEFAIARSFFIPWCPPQNSHAERMWGILLRCTRIMMVEAGINERFWEYAILHAALLHNVLPSSKLPDEISPYEALKGKQPDVSKFKTWGCTAWHHLHDHERKNKVSPVAVPSIHL